MNPTELITLYDQDQRRAITYPGMRREVTPRFVRHVDLTGTADGFITYSQLSETDADQTIRQQVSYFENIGQDFEWKLYDYDEPPDLKARLEAYGFVAGEAEALVLLDLEEAPAILAQPAGHNVRRITEPEGLADVQAVEQQVWDEEAAWVHDYLGGALRAYPQQMSVYVAYIDGQPASAAWTYFPENSQFASLWGGATIGRFRQRGLYTALLAVRAQEARARRVRYLVVDASDMSRPILQKFGFEWIATSYACKWKTG